MPNLQTAGSESGNTLLHLLFLIPFPSVCYWTLVNLLSEPAQ